ncbi:hypothetical protein HIM_06402 [Hirsutella minnesotensis 3608]|uniref:Uncharacterized protein n=1 Tax=Hirsutella minnesotensis 3608 TaxID=1043627 RepID=A0A0F7ZJ68_9HYPO|nr:hypothetical protein HIM_06402 [Hirsutella minnesotensis 3608]
MFVCLCGVDTALYRLEAPGPDLGVRECRIRGKPKPSLPDLGKIALGEEDGPDDAGPSIQTTPRALAASSAVRMLAPGAEPASSGIEASTRPVLSVAWPPSSPRREMKEIWGNHLILGHERPRVRSAESPGLVLGKKGSPWSRRLALASLPQRRGSLKQTSLVWDHDLQGVYCTI